ncbi:MAG TPA: 2-oxoacid:acceptor oxidoreductase subunit alpha [Thermoanaerobaculia bacterium]|nr:2-oxoacid:acceptor oxidoreductase subunit alpha [Thermoanaerobaculia bacterium]
MKSEFSVSIVGAGGDGAIVAGDILSMVCAREGLHVIKTEAYGPQIRGGESSCTVRISSTGIHAQADALDALVVLSWKDYAKFGDELTPAPNAIFFHDDKDAPPEGLGEARLIAVPFTTMAREAKNMVALGLLSAAFSLRVEPIRDAIRRRFANKSAEVIEANLTAFDAGATHDARDSSGAPVSSRALPIPSHPIPQLLMSGNEASAIAAIDAGCRFFAGYPITPSSEILHYLSEWLPRIGGACLQTEDELAAIGAVIGGSFAGVKSMTATSGPGLSLMAEMNGLASIAEVPAVIVNVQRGGPSTGIPTKSEQSDLLHAVFASHGDTPRAVIACTDVEDSYHCTVEAFNIAEEFQLPVIVLSDQMIAQRRETITADSLEHAVVERRLATAEELRGFARYRDTPSGVSPMSIPGMAGGIYQTNGLEHDESGNPASMFVTHERMNAKRFRKMDAIAEKYPLFYRYGTERADLGILCWGSSAGPVREAVEMLNAAGASVAAFVPRMIMPLPAREIEAFLASCAQILVMELSYSKQFYRYLKTEIDLPRETQVYARSGGKLLSVSEIVKQAELRLAPVRPLQEVMS